MQIDRIVRPASIESDAPYGYTPMDVAIEIFIRAEGQIGNATLKPLLDDGKTRLRQWLPDLPRSSNIAPIVGADKLDYYHPTRKPAYAEAMIAALTEMLPAVPQLQWILDWMHSDKPLELEQQIATELQSTEIAAIEGGRIVWRMLNGEYIHDLPAVQSAHAAQTLKRAGGEGNLLGVLPRIHTKKLPVPLFGCNDVMFRSWGQTEKQDLNISARSATIATLRYAQLLEEKGHHIRIAENRYWVWGALPEMAELSAANRKMAAWFGSVDGADLDPIKSLKDSIAAIENGSKSIGKVPKDLKIACGYIGIGGSGKGRAAIGQMSEIAAIDLLNNFLKFHQLQRRYLTRSNPYWVFGSLTVAEGSSKKAIEKANEQIFEAMINGKQPPPAITNAIVHRLKIEGVPHINKKKSSREWAQIAYLAWWAPEFIEDRIMKPTTTPENLLAWHVGRVFAACRVMAYYYAHPKVEQTQEESAKENTDEEKWKNPLDAYRQILFSSPSQAFAQIMAKVSPYLAARSDKAYCYHKALIDWTEDCSNPVPPKRWTDEQACFLALGISEMIVERRNAKVNNQSDETAAKSNA